MVVRRNKRTSRFIESKFENHENKCYSWKKIITLKGDTELTTGWKTQVYLVAKLTSFCDECVWARKQCKGSLQLYRKTRKKQGIKHDRLPASAAYLLSHFWLQSTAGLAKIWLVFRQVIFYFHSCTLLLQDVTCSNSTLRCLKNYLPTQLTQKMARWKNVYSIQSPKRSWIVLPTVKVNSVNAPKIRKETVGRAPERADRVDLVSESGLWSGLMRSGRTNYFGKHAPLEIQTRVRLCQMMWPGSLIYSSARANRNIPFMRRLALI